MASADQKTRVFLSYSRADEAIAVRLAMVLEASGDMEVFRDKEDILPAEEWRARLEQMLLAADAVVVCLSPSSIASREVLWEVQNAERLSKRIVPVVLRPFTDS